MTSNTRKEIRIAFRVTYLEEAELEKARTILDESISQFCKLALRARIRWALENHKPHT